MRHALAALLLLGSLAVGAEAAHAQSMVSIDDPTVAEGTGSNTSVTFTVTLSEAAPVDISVDWNATNGTGENPAVRPSDFSPGQDADHGTVEVPAGDTSATFQVPVVGDSMDEFDETFQVALSGIDPGTEAAFAPGGATGVATITDDDAPPTVSVEDTVVFGGSVSTNTNRLVIFDVKLSAPSGKPVVVDVFTRDPSGALDDGTQPAEACPASTPCSRTEGDYVTKRERKTLTPGVTSFTSQVIAIGDSLDVNKYVELVVAHTYLTSQAADFTEADVGEEIVVDGQPNAIASFVSESEIILADPAVHGSNVSFSLDSDDDGDIDGDDVTHGDGTVRGGSNHTIADGVGIGRIPSSGPSATITGVAVNEGGAGQSTPAQLTVTLDNPAPQELSLAYASANGSARAPGDYQAVPAGRRVVFEPGEVTATIGVPVLGNDLNESDKAFTVTLSDPKNVRLTAGNATAVVTIRNDDPTPGIVAPDVFLAEPRSGTTSVATVDVSLSAPSTRTLTATYGTRDGSAVAGVNYGQTSGTLTFSPGETAKRVDIPIAGNGAVTEDLSFTLAIQNTAGGGEVVARVVLIDSDLTADTMPAVTINDVSVRDSGRDGSDAVFTVRMDRTLGRSVRVDFATADGRARAPGDYTPVSGTATIPAGQATQTITVPVTIRRNRRRNESFRVVLSNPVGLRIARSSGVGVIIGDSAERLPVKVAPRRLRTTTVLCRRGRRCSGVRVRWRAPASGRVRVRVTALMPRRGSKRAKRVSLAKKSYRVRRGSRRVTIKRRAGRSTSRLLRRLRRGRARTVVVTVTFTDRTGARRLSQARLRLRR